MKPRAFVIMPFGKKPLDAVLSAARPVEPNSLGKMIDFDVVYQQLIEPALIQAGCEPARADSEVAAGDIRTDMFFELVTADVVIADISIANPNVFYELGVRHGVRPRGVLAIHNSLLTFRPFDVSVDRSFQYDGSLFAEGENLANLAPKQKKAVAELAQTLRRALQSDQQTTGSPVYEHLPGLIPVNWDKIQTSRSRYFGQLNDDWLDLVRQAQLNGYPGDIQTMADDAPTLFHRNLILYEATLALIDLCRYEAAERNLRKLVDQDTSDSRAQLKLSLVLAQQGRTELAETQLRKLLSQHEGEPHAGDLLGQVYRHLWHLVWKNAPDLEARRMKARVSVGQAAQAVDAFIQAQEYDPSAYFAGFNALLLNNLVADLFTGKEMPEVWQEFSHTKMEELAAVVRFCARNAQENARRRGDFAEQFWATTTLSGLELIRNREENALQYINEACSIAKATFFQLQTFRDRLVLLQELGFKSDEFVTPALEMIAGALRTKQNNDSGCRRVFLWAGYPMDKDSNPLARFSESDVDQVKSQIIVALSEWQMDEHDLAICEGSSEGDIIFAEQCQKRGTRVRLMLLDAGDQCALWPFESAEWGLRFKALRHQGAEEWFHTKHLGSLNTEGEKGDQALKMRHKNWIINTARFEAENNIESAVGVMNAATRLYGLFMWDGDTTESPDNPSFFIQRVNEFGDYKGEVRIIRMPHQPVEQRAATV